MFGFFLSMPGWKHRFTRVLLPLVTCASLAGCLADNAPIVQVVPEVVLAPQNPRFQAIDFVPPASGSMLVMWNRSVADTQLNFKGYLVELWKSDTDNTNPPGTDTLTQLLDSVYIFRTGTLVADTSCTFKGIPGYPQGIPLGRYTIQVYGVKADSTGTLSLDSSVYSALFDPLPLTNPTNIEATSAGPTQVMLHWTPATTERDTGFYRYVIYYRDTTKIDTGHVWGFVPKYSPQFLSSTAEVNVPGHTPLNQTSVEWPYQFWIKSERVDSTFVYGGDTNAVVWAGAEHLSSPGSDSVGWGGIHNSIFIGSFNQNLAIVDDSNRSDMQVKIDTNGGVVTLTGENGVRFLDDGTGSARMDTASALDSIFYTYPYATPSQFTVKSATLPKNATSAGIVLYLMIPDKNLHNAPEWARLFIKSFGGAFLNASGGIHCDASFQPAVSSDGTQHLPYY